MGNREPSKVSNIPYLERNQEVLEDVFTKANLIGRDAAILLQKYNRDLALNADEIKKNQKNVSGAITLHLRPCTGCIGCPHPTWYKWYNPTNGSSRNAWTAKSITSPLTYMRRKPEYDLIRPIVVDSMEIIKSREVLLKAYKALSSIIREKSKTS